MVGAGHREEQFSSIALVADHQVSRVLGTSTSGRALALMRVAANGLTTLCETCGHTISLEEISRHIVNSIASPQAVEDTG